PRLLLSSRSQPAPLTAADGATGHGVPALIEGHQALIESGPPAPQSTGVYWKPSAGYLISVVGYRVPRSVVVRVAEGVSFAAPGIVALPVTAGRIVSRQAAISAAERSTTVSYRNAAAKLSSWTEIAAVAGRVQQVPAAPRDLTGSPWRPAWAVLLSGSGGPASVVVVDAASGQAEFTIAVRGSWFGALTDRDPAAARQCPGGSSALLPFGVLTRSEEEFTLYPSPAGGHARASVRLVLSTVPAVNKADNALFGGCGEQSCSIDQLVWVTITTVRADPGTTVACLPGTVSVPPGYKPKQVRQYYVVAVPDNLGIGCTAVPASLGALHDLAPPSQAAARGG
ncbi:MAG TPA: hypothetical protein VEL03_09290, partial [Streptosporangiaceae bacterium]|nr:hypothetical protein [Streptosporangiaceae bacterium]